MEYTYDELNRLTGAYDTKSWEYGYDDNGNITYETVNGVKNVYTYAKFDADVLCGYGPEKSVGESIEYGSIAEIP